MTLPDEVADAAYGWARGVGRRGPWRTPPVWEDRPGMVPHHGTEGPLHYRAFRHSLVARVVSSGGSWMQTVAAGG
jgi:hypothetical protein